MERNETIFGMGWAIGPTIGGPITQSFGNESPYLVFCVIGIGVTLFAINFRKKTRTTENLKLDIHRSTFFSTEI